MLKAALRITMFSLLMTFLTGLAYPLLVTGFSQAIFPDQANGSLVEKDGRIIGSKLIAQNFVSPRYFHPRPSATGYEGDNSGASNLGMTSKALNAIIKNRIAGLERLNGKASIPADLVTASGSGLDPHITPEAALYQVERVAHARKLRPEEVQALVDRMTEGRTLGVLGMPRVNVLALNLELDRMPNE